MTRQPAVPAEPVLARSRDAVFFHFRSWPADPAVLLDRLSERAEPSRYVTLPWDVIPATSLDSLEQAIRDAGGRLRFIEYESLSPEADELGFRLAQTLHEEGSPRASAAGV